MLASAMVASVRLKARVLSSNVMLPRIACDVVHMCRAASFQELM